jgi:lipopolysaccharide transport system ATP-binding protein
VTAITFDRVGKRYRRNDRFGKRRSVRWALRNLSLEVAAGETVGLIGANGAGKSTVLRLALGITSPSEGRVSTNGRMAGVLSLGDGFHPLLTGHENAVTFCMLSGLTHDQAKSRLPAVREFSGLGDAFDDPLRTYSSGMFVRLAFAVAVNVDSDVLLIDEALAVGDLEFASRCIDYLESRQQRGTTMLLASHDLDQIRRLCHRVAWLEGGSLRAIGSPVDVTGDYGRAMHTPGTPSAGVAPDQIGSHEVEFQDITLSSQGRELDGVLPTGWPVTIAMSWVAHSQVESMIFGVSIHDESGTRCLDMTSPAVVPDAAGEKGMVRLILDRLDLGGGTYHLDVGIYDHTWNTTYDYRWQAHWFGVAGPRSQAPLQPPHTWEAT